MAYLDNPRFSVPCDGSRPYAPGECVGSDFSISRAGHPAGKHAGVIRRAMAYGTVVASYTISDFSLDGLRAATRVQVDQRYAQFKSAMDF